MSWVIIKTMNGWLITQERAPIPPLHRPQDAYVFETMQGLANWLVSETGEQPKAKKK